MSGRYLAAEGGSSGWQAGRGGGASGQGPASATPSPASQVALVTGSTSGIGEAAAVELARRGYSVHLAFRNKTKAVQTLKKMRQACPGGDVHLAGHLDTSSQASVRSFAAMWRASGRPLHILLLNAGALTRTTNFTEEGIAELAQVNYLGAYLLTRLLEDVLVASGCRVVSVSSVTHRMGNLGSDPLRDFLHGDWGHHYTNTKLANCMFAYELQRRLGRAGVQSCAVDPGGVRTAVWRRQPWLLQKAVALVYAPPEEGAKPLVHAATAAWERPEGAARSRKRGGRAGGGAGALPPPEQDLRYYAPEAFALPVVTFYKAEGNRGALGALMMRLFSLPITTPWGLFTVGMWAVLTILVSVLDWPVRRVTGGRWMSRVVLAPSSPLSYSEELATALWNASADVTGLPRQPQLRRGDPTAAPEILEHEA